MPVVNKQVSRKPQPKSNSLWDSIVPISKLQETGLKFLIYGISHTGKTTLACSFPKPLLFLRPDRAEDGTKSVKKVPGIEVPRPITEPAEIEEVVSKQTASQRFKTIVLDGVTDYQSLVIKHVLGLAQVPEKLQFGIATRETWGVINLELQTYLGKLLYLAEQGTNIVIVGAERTMEIDSSADPRLIAPTVMVALSPASQDWLHRKCNYSVQLFIRRKIVTREVTVNGKKQMKEFDTGKKEFCCRTGIDDVYMTKFCCDRGTLVPDIVVDADYERLKRIIDGQG